VTLLLSQQVIAVGNSWFRLTRVSQYLQNGAYETSATDTGDKHMKAAIIHRGIIKTGIFHPLFVEN